MEGFVGVVLWLWLEGRWRAEVLFLLVVLRGWHPPLSSPGPYPFFKLPMSLPVPSPLPASLPLSK